MVLFLALLGSCASPVQSDYDAYLANDCTALSDDVLHDECLFFVVAQRPAESDALCGAVRRAHFKDACFFMAADAGKVTGEDAAQACRKAGVYAHECLGHVILRDFEATHPDSLAPKEMVDTLRDLHRRYGRPDGETRTRVLAAVAERAAKDPTCCEVLPELCGEAGVKR